MKEKRISRMLAILLVFMMVFTLIPGTALAEAGSTAGNYRSSSTDYEFLYHRYEDDEDNGSRSSKGSVGSDTKDDAQSEASYP